MEHTEIKSLGLLANYLNIEKSILNKICSEQYEPISAEDFRKAFAEGKDLTLLLREQKIVKKNGGFRLVYAPISDTLINCLKILNKKLSSLYKKHISVHGFVKGKSIKTNAEKHLAKNFIFKADIKKYFKNIDVKKVISALTKLGFTKDISVLISKIVTYEGTLVQGFHTSPTIANIVFYEIDEIFSNIGSEIEYTRYADDLYFSSNNNFDIHNTIIEKLSKFEFTLNEDKTRLMKRGQNQYVTGLTVFDSEHPRIAKSVKRKLRQNIHYICKYGYKAHVMHNLKVNFEDYKSDSSIKNKVDGEIEYLSRQINGWLLFINSVEPKFSEKYSSLLKNRNLK